MRQLQLVFCNLLSASLLLSGETSQQSLSERNFAPAWARLGRWVSATYIRGPMRGRLQMMPLDMLMIWLIARLSTE